MAIKILIIEFTWKYISECIANNKITTYFASLFCLAILILLLYKYMTIKYSPKVYLINFACYKPPSTWMCSKELAAKQIGLMGNYSEEMIDLMKQAMFKGGLGDSTYVPEALLGISPTPSLEAAREEAEMVMFGAIDDLLEKTSNVIQCKDIGILIVNCSIFNVVPSLSSMIMHRYKLNENILSYNLTGMGCSAGLHAIDLAKQLLQVHSDQYALVVTTEIITQNCYTGKDNSKTTTNLVFRVGGAAILLTNKSSDSKLSKYQLIHTVHINNARSDLSYKTISQEEDQQGITGISISKDLLIAASNAIESNLATLGPLVLPLSEKIKYVTNSLLRGLHLSNVPKYIPKFNKCVDHFLPHVGGKPVLDQLQIMLGFSDAIMEASRMCLYRFGNTSSSSIWYEMAYIEAKGRVKTGNRVWQIAYGSGFKSNSVIWRAMKDIIYEETNPWNEEIDEYPINLDNIGPFHHELYSFKSSNG